MAERENWAFPSDLRPKPEEWRFDLERTLDSVVLLRAEVPEDAYTAQILGTERVGNGVVIGEDGLVLTIGYLVTEASTIWLTTNRGTVAAGFPVAYDQPTGFGLVQPLGPLGVPALKRGTAASCRVGDNVVVAGHGGRAHALKATVFAKREFAGYWEYVLDEALYTAPAHPQWGGTALVGGDGQLLGIGSLLVQEKIDSGTIQGNMIVPIDLLEPILDDMVRFGRPDRPARPWLGLYATEIGRHTAVAALAAGAPAERAGVQVGDIVLEVANERVSGLADLFRKIWRLGQAGIQVPLTLAREGKLTRLTLRSSDRNDFLKKPHLH
ncbi:MAG: signal protein PDZ [Betaproteobacteria bacterium RIFCSPHIGHO2_12_FULL_69_13]|nr:MAG: signal protein PDZ [Betaproteobacteria bacterium RIFCSPHIGHO2_12_FULL_69_13]OGA70277.1 MAG: signal protein PDZ [Betaproteobacteria bacterium RIFCSPLOWO2_12_FULL_68_20]